MDRIGKQSSERLGRLGRAALRGALSALAIGMLPASSWAADSCKLRMQIAHPAFEVLMGDRHSLWTVVLVAKDLVGDLQSGDEIVATVAVQSASCSVTRLSRADQAPGEPASMIRGRYIGLDQITGDAMLVLAPFPIKVHGATYAAVRTMPDKAILFDATYSNTHGKYVFRHIQVVGHSNRSPIMWK